MQRYTAVYWSMSFIKKISIAKLLKKLPHLKEIRILSFLLYNCSQIGL